MSHVRVCRVRTTSFFVDLRKPASASEQACNMTVGHFGGAGCAPLVNGCVFLCDFFERFILTQCTSHRHHNTHTHTHTHTKYPCDRSRYDCRSEHGWPNCHLRTRTLCLQPAIAQRVAAGMCVCVCVAGWLGGWVAGGGAP